MSKNFLIVDGNSLIFRAFHAMPLMDWKGTYTNAIFGFLNMLLKCVKEEEADYLAICFDEHAPTFRHVMYPDYKAGRAPTPPELIQQLGTIRSLLTDMGVKWYALAGWEADDLLGTLSRQGAEQGLTPLLLTGDRDAMQLVDDTTRLIFTRKGISETIHFTPETMFEEYGFYPTQVTDWKGLAGDSSDNIPGIPGVGDKTAVKLLQQYGSLEEILAHDGEIKGKLGEKIRANEEVARRCRELATIRRDAPVTLDLQAVAVPDWSKAVPALEKLHLNSIIRRITGDGAATAVPKEPEVTVPEILYGEPAVIGEAAALKGWLSAVKARPLHVVMGEAEISLAEARERCCLVTLGGDLLNPGLTPEEVLTLLAEDLSAHPAIVHHGKKLLHALDRLGLPLPERFAWDTMLGAYLLNPQEKSYELQDLLPAGTAANACALAALAARQQAWVRQNGMEELMMQVELPLQQVLFRMEKTGCRIDPAFLKELNDKYTEEIARVRQQFFAACGVEPFNVNSTQQLGQVLFEKLQLPHGKKTSRGYSTSAEVLEGLRELAPEIIDPLLRYRQLTKLNSTYIEALPALADDAGRVHSTFDQVGTATGRISSSEPNLQNIPVRTPEGREIRQAFIPREGWILLDADYSQIELRLMAHFSGDPALVEAFCTGQDIHTRTASEIFEVPVAEVTKELRSRAKAVNFGLIYGISGFGLAKNTGVSQREAQGFISRYFARYPGVKQFMDEAAEQGSRLGYAETLMGRRRYLPELKSDKSMIREFGKRAAMNTPVQGTAADIIKLAMVRIDEALRREGMETRLILQVHDELLLEAPPAEAEKAARLLREAMENVMELAVPLVAEVEQGQNWAEAH